MSTTLSGGFISVGSPATHAVVDLGEEWIWVKRVKIPDGLSQNACMAWKIQRKNLLRNENVQCMTRLKMNGVIDNQYDYVHAGPKNVQECTEYEAFNYWKPVINYQIY